MEEERSRIAEAIRWLREGVHWSPGRDVQRLAQHDAWGTSQAHCVALGRARNTFVLLVESANACLSAMAQNSRQPRQSLRCIPAGSDTLPEAERNPAPAPGHV
jgi:hypothetical protein